MARAFGRCLPYARGVSDSIPQSAGAGSKAPELKRGTLGLLLVVVLLDLLGIGLLIPVIPFLVKQFTENALIAGVLGTTYALFQFLATPVLGAISDRVGRRPVLILSLFGSAVGYVIFGLAGGAFGLAMLFIGRVIDGTTGGNISTAYAYAADCSTPATRAKTFGMMGAAMGLGFIIGPAVGGQLASIDIHLPAYCAAGAALLSAMWAVFVLPESLPKEKRARGGLKFSELNPLKTVTGKFVSGAFLPPMASVMVMTFTQTAMHGVFAWWAKDKFGWGPKEVSYVLVMAGVVAVIVQGGLVRVFAKAIGNRMTLVLGMLLLAVAAGLLGFCTQAWMVWSCMALWSFGSGLAGAAGTAMISNLAGATEQGEAMGVNQALTGLMRVCGPLWGGFAYERFGAGVQYLVPGVLTLVVAMAVLARGTPDRVQAAAAAPDGGKLE